MAVTRKSRKSGKDAQSKGPINPSGYHYLDSLRNIYGLHSVIFKMFFVFCYYFIGCLAYNHLEGWSIIDCVYFITVSCTTIGYGDFHPTHNTTRIFHIPFLICGVVLIFGYCNEFAKAVLMHAQDEVLDWIRIALKRPLSVSYKRNARVTMSIFSVFIITLAGTLFYKSNEGWSTLNALYWCVCTMTTMGYGKCMNYVFIVSRPNQMMCLLLNQIIFCFIFFFSNV